MKTHFVLNSLSASRLSLISLWRSWNTSLDFVFYDTSSLTEEERAGLSGYNSPLGRILVVYPASSKRPIRSLTTLEFVQEQSSGPADPVNTVTIAGVGSSALGTASLARDVANFFGRPVAGIVSGLGLSDVVAEAVGGWFVFGFANAIRYSMARTLDNAGIEDHVRTQATHDAIRKHLTGMGIDDPDFFIYGSPDSTALLYILSKLGPRIKCLVGHSKGNLSIENALEGLLQSSKSGDALVAEELQIITLGAVIWFEPQVRRVKQFIGQIDGLGMINSRPDLRCVVIPGAWHSLNAQLPGHLSVAQALELAKQEGFFSTDLKRSRRQSRQRFRFRGKRERLSVN